VTEEEILARDRTVCLELTDPVAVGSLCGEQGRLRPLDGDIDLGRGCRARHVRYQRLWVARIARY